MNIGNMAAVNYFLALFYLILKTILVAYRISRKKNWKHTQRNKKTSKLSSNEPILKVIRLHYL